MREERGADAGTATPVEMIVLLLFGLAAMGLLGYLGALHAAGVEITTAAQSAARAGSMAASPVAAQKAATAAVQQVLVGRCTGGPSTRFTWAPSPTGSWRGGAVTVEVRCAVVGSSRTLTASDTQPVDRYRR
mgnify:FL=1